MMNNKPLASINNLSNIRTEVPITLREKWQPLALTDNSQNDINILDEIGDDCWSESDTTLNRVNRKLQQANGADVTVNINSYGGEMMEGLAIYNALCLYNGKVIVNILGIAASAASIIAMAGNEIRMSPASFLMIHNCWSIVIGNRHGLIAMADKLKDFDQAMASIYAAQSQLDIAEITSMMDAETYLDGNAALAKGFATELFEPKVEAYQNKSLNALRTVDNMLAKQGLSRAERRDLLNQIKGTQDAAKTSTQDATQNLEFQVGLAALNLELNRLIS